MSEEIPPVDLDRPSVGRIYDYLLGGTHNYAIDREFAERQIAVAPGMRAFAVNNRRFLGRAVRFAAGEGVRQFVDIGSGLPTQGNVHEVADEVAPGQSRVVYVDNEPIAHAHARVLLESTADERRHVALHGDFFEGPALWRRVLDTGRIDEREPICLLLVALLHFMPPESNPGEVLAYFRDRLPEGSLLVLSHAAIDPDNEELRVAAERIRENYTERATQSAMVRSREEIAEFFGDFELVEPGLVWLSRWRPDGVVTEDPVRSGAYGGVARKP